MNDFQQHILKSKNIIKLKRKFNKFNFNNKHILEIGIGTGQFTKCFYNKKLFLTAFEIDKNLKYQIYKNKLNKKNVKIVFKPFELSEIFKYKKYIIISAPPYILLEGLSKEIKKYKMKFLLMVGERYLKYFEKFKIIQKIEGKEFIPLSRGNHFIISNI